VFELAMWSMRADGRIEDIWINFETSSHYCEYGGYSPEFNYQRGVSSESMMEDIDQVVEPHHVHEIFPHHAGAALPNAPILSSTFGAVIARWICSSEPIRTNTNRLVGYERVVLGNN
jgi:hypothetical protein